MKAIRKPEDLSRLNKKELIEFLRSERENRVELWNAWQEMVTLPEDKTVDLLEADLSNTVLEGIHFFKVNLQGADFRSAHLEWAKFTYSYVNNAVFSWAHLEDAVFEESFCEGMYLLGTHLERARFWKVNLEGIEAQGAHFEGASISWSSLKKGDLLGAIMTGSKLIRTNLREAILTSVDLKGAFLGGVNLSDAALSYADLAGAELFWNNFRDVAFGDVAKGGLCRVKLNSNVFHGSLGLRYTQFLEDESNPLSHSTTRDETDGEFSRAKETYKNLKGHFEEMGDYEGANWAYIREQVMEKLMFAPPLARWLYGLFVPRWRGKWTPDKEGGIFWKANTWEWLRLEIAEKTANYGLSLLRPIICLISIVVLFALFYLVGGMVTVMPECAYGSGSWHMDCTASTDLLDALWFSLASLTSTEIVAVQPYLSHVALVQTLEVLFGVAFTGLIGFVLGNKMRYS